MLEAVTETLALLLVAVIGDQLLSLARSLAFVPMAASLALRVCIAVTARSAVETLLLSMVCGRASSCMSWLMIVAVSRPLTRPPMLVLAICESSPDDQLCCVGR